MKLNIGCGPFHLKGWINIDSQSDWTPAPDIVFDVSEAGQLLCLAKLLKDERQEEITRIYLGHLLSSLTDEQGLDVLIQCYKILSPGGRIRVAEFEVDWLLNYYFQPCNDQIMMNQSWNNKRDLNGVRQAGKVFRTPWQQFHFDLHRWKWKFPYDRQTLVVFLKEAGFQSVVERAVGFSIAGAFIDVESRDGIVQFCLEAERYE